MIPRTRPAMIVALATLTVCGVAPAGAPRNTDDLAAAMHDLAGTHPACTVDVIGASREGRGILVLTLSADPATAGERPALLVTAGIDGRHFLGTETALRVAREILNSHGDLLAESTVYVIPRVNPDAAEANLRPPMTGHAGTFRMTDDDHDGVRDEDGAVDLDGNGIITMMRRAMPPLDEAATHMADPAEPRLMKKPDSTKGERATYALYPEGLDQDGDGAIAEDGPGAVDLDRNFMHLWPEHKPDAGPYQLSEPESAALATFVIEHKNIFAAITYGRHDNLVKPPDGKGKDVTGRAPKNIDGADVKLYKEISERYREITGQERADTEDIAGAFHAWLYAQRGIPSFAARVW